MLIITLNFDPISVTFVVLITILIKSYPNLLKTIPLKISSYPCIILILSSGCCCLVKILFSRNLIFQRLKRNYISYLDGIKRSTKGLGNYQTKTR